MKNPSHKPVRSWDVFCQRLFAQNQFVIKLGLENMRDAIASESQRLGVDLLTAHPVIMIAGTNGKGSTAAFISAILQAHGLRVGLYTSPHLVDFRERFRVDGQLLPEVVVERIGNEVLERYGSTDSSNPCLTFFELTTMMAIRLFHQEEVDIGVYEIGLGGRLDAVNALEPSVSVIASIDFDHAQYLGTTLEEIAREKCGVFRANSRAVVGFQEHARVMNEIESLAPKNTVFLGRDFSDSLPSRIIGLPLSLNRASEVMRLNAQTALAASRSYLGDTYDAEKAAYGLACMRWPGRMDLREVQVVFDEGENPTRIQYLLDAAHNEASVRALFEHLERANIEPCAVVVGAMADKALNVMFERLTVFGVPVFGVEIANQRAANAAQLQAAIEGADELGSSNSVWRGAGPCGWALEMAGREAGDSGQVILVFGSIYLLGEFFSWAGTSAEALVTYVDSVQE